MEKSDGHNKKKRKITTVIFDLDDTLYDEVDYCKSGFKAIAKFLNNSMRLPKWLDYQKIYDELWDQFEQGNRSNTFNKAMDELGIGYNEEVISSMVRIYRQHRPDIKMPQDNRKILDQLKNNYQLGILTDGFMPAQHYKVIELEIADYFNEIMYTELVGRCYWKPHTKCFEMLLKKLKTRPEECVYIGDNAEKDFIGPNKLGMATIQLVKSNRIHTAAPANQQAAPNQIIGSLLQLPAALKKLK